MSLWLGDFQFEEEFNDEKNYATLVGVKFAGTLGSTSDIDWYGVSLPKGVTVKVTFEELNYQPGTWNVCWFSSGMQGLSELNITTSSRDGPSSYTYTFNTGDSGGTYYARIKPYSPSTYKGDVYKVTVDVPKIPTISLVQSELQIVEGNSGFKPVPAAIKLDSPSSGFIVVHYTVRSGTANVGTPYDSDVIGTTGGSLTFAPGETVKSLDNTTIWSDTNIEANEYFWIDFDQIKVGTAQFLGGVNTLSEKITILDDDTDRMAPTVVSFKPRESLVGLPVASDIVITFNEAIVKGIGSITLKTATGIKVATYDVGSSVNLTINGDVLTVNPTADLAYSTLYTLEIAAGSIKDLAGNAFASTASYDFTTTIFPGQILSGNANPDSLSSTPGNDVIDGGAGVDTAVFSGNFSGYQIEYNRVLGTATVTDKRIAPAGDGVDSLKSIEVLKFADKTFDLINPVRTETPVHSKSQSFLFDPSFYLLKNPELVPSVTLSTAFNHYQSVGAAAREAPNPWFDAVYYANKWPDLKALNLDAATLFTHYNLYGVWEGRSAGPTFDKYDGARYLKDNPDVAAYVDGNVEDFLGSRSNGAIAHYLIYGAAEGRVAYDTSGVAIEQAILIGVPG